MVHTTRHRRLSSDHGTKTLDEAINGGQRLLQEPEAPPPALHQQQPAPSPPPPPPSSSSSPCTQSSPEVPAGRSFNSPDIRSSSAESGSSFFMDYSDSTSNELQPARSSNKSHRHAGDPRVVGTSTFRTAEDVESQHSRSHTTGSRSPSPHSGSFNAWMTQLAYSFRSPPPPSHQKRISHHPSSQQLLHEARHHAHSVRSQTPSQGHHHQPQPASSSEATPLIKDHRGGSHGSFSAAVSHAHLAVEEARKIRIAAAFLGDYEASRPPTLSYQLEEITDRQLKLHEIKHSTAYTTVLWVSVLLLFASSGLEQLKGDQPWWPSKVGLTTLNLLSLSVLAVDVVILRQLRTGSILSSNTLPLQSLQEVDDYYASAHLRDQRSERLLVKPVILFAVFLAVENLARVAVASDDAAPQTLSSTYSFSYSSASSSTSGLVLISSLFKPLVLFYVSYQARNALEALRRILSMVLRVLVMESLLILMFAAVGCRLFAGYEQFDNLSTAWLSLFELSTTVVNPSIWMPMYRESKASAAFFIFFVVTCVFYLHSLVLSVVFSTYIYAAGEIHERSVADREDAVHLAYRALVEDPDSTDAANSIRIMGGVRVGRLRPMLQRLRPHYNPAKIAALLEIMETNAGPIDYPTFRHKIRQALNASIRTPRNASTAAMAVELLAVIVAVGNFAYVLLVSSQFDVPWFGEHAEAVVGCGITFVASTELLIRFNPLRIADFTPLTRLNATFDGLALAGAVISFMGILLLRACPQTSLQLILMGRAVDMIRVMRFFRIFRDVVRRSSDVLPVLAGPSILVVSTLHIFVYLGMALWGGAVHVGQNSSELTPLYDLNNFNSYQEGVVTMFQVLVVNDWHSIAKVFLFADRFSNPWIVYPFFILGNLIGVSIMLNVLTAFFVESFVTKVNDDSDDHVVQAELIPDGVGSHPRAAASPVKRRDRLGDFTIQTPENSTVRRISSVSSSLMEQQQQQLPHPVAQQRRQTSFDVGGDADADADDSDMSAESEFYEFDVYEREGLDKIMQTVAGGSGQQYSSEFARQLCDYLETFESLAPERESIGFLVCDQLTLERFGNRRFQNLTVGFLEASDLHAIVSDMHAELLALASRVQDRSLMRTFHQDQQVLEISAALLRRHPALSLFVTRVRKS